MMDFFGNHSINEFTKDINAYVESLRMDADCGTFRSFGVSSGHLYFAIPLIHKILGNRARFILTIREPEGFVRSALARGFFDPAHPHYCQQLPLHACEKILRHGRATSVVTPFEVNCWYWRMVNEYVLRSFAEIPHELWRVLPLENLCAEKLHAITTWLGIDDMTPQKIDALLKQRINASPLNGEKSTNSESINPYSIPVNTDKLSEEQYGILELYTKDIAANIAQGCFYPGRNLLPITDELYAAMKTQSDALELCV
jgi:hypothetical protein